MFHFFWSVFRVWLGFFFLLLLSVCVWVRVGVRGCARGVRVPGAGCTAVYSCTNWSWSLVQSLESWWMHFLLVVSKQKCCCSFLFSRRGVVSPSFPLPPCPVSPVSPVVVADPNVFGTTLKFLFGKKKQNQQNTQKKDFKNNLNKSPAWKYLLKKYVSKKKFHKVLHDGYIHIYIFYD